MSIQKLTLIIFFMIASFDANVCLVESVVHIMRYPNTTSVQPKQARRAVVGILTLPVREKLRNKINEKLGNYIKNKLNEDPHTFFNKSSFYPQSYAKWLQEFDVETVPLDIHKGEKFLVSQLDSLDGLLLTGGATPLYDHNQSILVDGPNSQARIIRKSSLYTNIVAALLDKAILINKDRKFPVWGTCLGFESLILSQSKFKLGTNNVENMNRSSKITFINTDKGLGKKLAEDPSVFAIASQKPVYYFNHHWGFRKDHFDHYNNENKFWDVIATAKTATNQEIVVFVQAINYPFFAVQYHPEKNEFELNPRVNADHGEEAKKVSRKLAEMFVDFLEVKDKKPHKVEELIKLIDRDETIIKMDNVGIFDELIMLNENKNRVRKMLTFV